MQLDTSDPIKHQVSAPTNTTRVFRASYVSMTGIFLIALLVSPLVMIGVHIAVQTVIIDMDVSMGIAMVLTLGLLALIPAWYIRLRVWLSPDRITRRTLFGTTSVLLSNSARFKIWTLRIGTPHMYGVGALIDSITDENAHMRYFLTIENEGKTIKLGSTLKNVNHIAAFLQKYELDHILPLLQGMVASGQIVDSGALRQKAREIHLGRKVITKPLSQPCEINGPTMTLHYIDKKPRKVVVKLKDVWNPYSTQALLSR